MSGLRGTREKFALWSVASPFHRFRRHQWIGDAVRFLMHSPGAPAALRSDADKIGITGVFTGPQSMGGRACCPADDARSRRSRGLQMVALLLSNAGFAGRCPLIRRRLPEKANRIFQSTDAAGNDEWRGDGPQGKFFPSRARPDMAGNIPSKYFMQSDACQRCTRTFINSGTAPSPLSSFNNQLYRQEHRRTCRMLRA